MKSTEIESIRNYLSGLYAARDTYTGYDHVEPVSKRVEFLNNEIARTEALLEEKNDDLTIACLEEARELIAPYSIIEPWATELRKIDETLLKLQPEQDDECE